MIDQRTFKVVAHFAVGALPQHVVPAWDLKTLYVTNDLGNSLTPINPRTGKPGQTIPVDDPYNMYFTPDGRYAIVVAERLHRLDFRDAHTFKLHHVAAGPVLRCRPHGLLRRRQLRDRQLRVLGPAARRSTSRRSVSSACSRSVAGAAPQDVKLSPDGMVFYVADMNADGVWLVDGATFRVLRFMPTGAGAHGLYPSRDARDLYVTNRGEGSISVISFATRRVVKKWHIAGGGSPDMGNVSADGKILWLTGRYNGVVYAISTRTGRLLAQDPGRVRPARALRLAAARPLLTRSHGHPAVGAPTPRRALFDAAPLEPQARAPRPLP